MFFLLVIVLLIVFYNASAHMPHQEWWFMVSLFVGGAYLAGFFDSRLSHKADQTKANLLAEIEARYEKTYDVDLSVDPLTDKRKSPLQS